MNARFPLLVVSFLSGLLFAIGLGIGGMLHPPKVIGFLDFFGDWDPSLLFVMGGGMLASFALLRLARRREQPVCDARFHLPTAKQIDAPLVVGSALFGIGWGLAGYCPGPGIVSAATLSSDALWFFAAMAAGAFAFRVYKASKEADG